MMNPKTKSLLQFAGLFFLTLLLLYLLWLPFAGGYLWIRLKCSYMLLNAIGYYPKFSSPSAEYWQGEFFSFLPFLALMIASYKKDILKKTKPIHFILLLLFVIEVLGRFFEKLSFLIPTSPFLQPITIFFLATARVSLPFLFWLFFIVKDRKSLF